MFSETECLIIRKDRMKVLRLPKIRVYAELQTRGLFPSETEKTLFVMTETEEQKIRFLEACKQLGIPWPDKGPIPSDHVGAALVSLGISLGTVEP